MIELIIAAVAIVGTAIMVLPGQIARSRDYRRTAKALEAMNLAKRQPKTWKHKYFSCYVYGCTCGK